MTSLTITARQLKTFLAPVVPLAGTNDDLPILNSVRVSAEGSWLVAEATDRYVVGIHRLAGSWGTDFAAILPLATIRGIQAAFRPARTEDPQLTLTALTADAEHPRLTVESAGAMLDMEAASITYALRTGKWPDLRSLVAQMAVRPPHAGTVALRVRHLARFTAADDGAGLHYTPGDPARKHPTTVRGRNFLGAVMPLVGEGDLSGLDDWGGILGATEPQAVSS